MAMLLNKKVLPLFVYVLWGPLLALGVKSNPGAYSQEKDGVSVCVRLLSTGDVQDLCNCYNPVKIIPLTNRYKIFEILVENKTEQEYVLAPENIDLKIENSLVIKSKIKASPVLIPLFTCAAAITLFTVGLGIAVLPSVIAGSALGITALNINIQQSNHLSMKRIQARMLDRTHPTLIPSFSKVRKFIFVAIKNARNHFPLVLESSDSTQKILFDVVLLAK